MAKKKKRSGMSLLALILLVILTVLIGLLTTEYFYLKEKYAGSAVAYSREQIRDLDMDSTEYKLVKMFYTDEQLENIRDNTVSVDETAQNTNGTGDPEKDIEIVPVYGSTYEGYMMLVHNPEDISVADIAQRLGYDNASKFSAAFRDIMGVTPQQYRKRQEDF